MVPVPVVDLAFVVDQLNRLDVGSSEKALLQSRDGETLLIARYADIHRAVQQSMAELVLAQSAASTQAQPSQYSEGDINSQ